MKFETIPMAAIGIKKNEKSENSAVSVFIYFLTVIIIFIFHNLTNQIINQKREKSSVKNASHFNALSRHNPNTQSMLLFRENKSRNQVQWIPLLTNSVITKFLGF